MSPYLERKVFAGVIKLRISDETIMDYLVVLNPMTSVLIRNRGSPERNVEMKVCKEG